MDQESIRILDELREYDNVIEVDYRPDMQDVRTICGLFAGFERATSGTWYLILSGKAAIRTIDIVSVRRKEQVRV